MKGLFIPEITTEMFRNGCLESIEALMAEGEIYDIDYQHPCEDAISRDAVEKITWEEPSYDDALNVLTEVRDKVRALPSVKPEIKWIPVSEKLPNRGDTVIATFKSPVTGMPFVATTHIVREPKEVVKDSNIIAWMPIMKPYKEKKE